MNLLLLEPTEVSDDSRARIHGRRWVHVREVLRAGPGDVLEVGVVGGRIGTGRILSIDPHGLELEIALLREPPEPLPVALALALPRPPTLRKVLQQATALGSKRTALFAAERVEKSFWQSRALEPEALGEQLRLGLEQARDTVLPRIELERRFGAFCERVLPALAAGGPIWLGDVGAPPPPREAPALIVLGPEGGLLAPEIARLESAGARRVGLGVRALRVETAAVALLGIAAERAGYTPRPSWT